MLPSLEDMQNGVSENGDVVLVLVSMDDADQAASLAHAMVEQGLAACVQVSAAGVSMYRWQGQIVKDAEFYLSIKTLPEHAEAACAWLTEHHPYETPEIVVLQGTAALSYRQWMEEVQARA